MSWLLLHCRSLKTLSKVVQHVLPLILADGTDLKDLSVADESYPVGFFITFYCLHATNPFEKFCDRSFWQTHNSLVLLLSLRVTTHYTIRKVIFRKQMSGSESIGEVRGKQTKTLQSLK